MRGFSGTTTQPRVVPAALLLAGILFASDRADAQRPVPPCCSIVAVDAGAGLVTAKVNANGNVFQFKPNRFSPADALRSNPATLASLKPGQAVYANFTNHQVSLDGRTVCCTMTSGPQAAQNVAKVLPNQLNHSLGSWTTKAAMPTATSNATAGVVNGILYVVGGTDPSGHIGAAVEAYDPATNTWTTKARMLAVRLAPASGVVNGILYVVGGLSCLSLSSYCVMVEAYNPATNTWTTKVPPPTARSHAAAGVVNGILYVAGGRDSSGDLMATVVAYDPATIVLWPKAPMPTVRSHAAAGLVNGILYVVGGIADPSGHIVATVEAYDPATNTWTTKAPMPTARASASAGVVDGILYVVGGFGVSGIVGTVEAYDPATNTWTTKAPMPTARHSASAGVVDGILYVAGGRGPLELATVEAYHP